MKTEQWLSAPALFLPLWQGEWTPDERMLDFKEKWQAFHTPNGRLMVCAHRGDRNELYPENSLEGFYSAILAGADILEADIHTAADGTLVVLHDDTLTRTTNVSALRAAGEADLPPTDHVTDWTWAQLCRLRLTMPDGCVTDCALPALEQLIALAKGRVFITLDKAHAFSFEQGVLPLLEKHSAYAHVLIPYEYPAERVLAIQQEIYRRCGHYAPYFAKAIRGAGVMDAARIEAAVGFLRENGLAPLLRGGEFVPEEQDALAPVLTPLRGEYRIYAETLRAPHDNADHWRQMAALGYNIIMGNRNYALLRFAKAYNYG